MRAWLFALAALITLHSPKGDPIFVNGDEIMVITDSGPNSTKKCRADVLVHDKWICVQETPRQVREARDGANG